MRRNLPTDRDPVELVAPANSLYIVYILTSMTVLQSAKSDPYLRKMDSNGAVVKGDLDYDGRVVLYIIKGS